MWNNTNQWALSVGPDNIKKLFYKNLYLLIRKLTQEILTKFLGKYLLLRMCEMQVKMQVRQKVVKDKDDNVYDVNLLLNYTKLLDLRWRE